MSRSFLARFIAALLLVFTTAVSAKPPVWLTALAAKPAAMDYGSASHAVLLDESELSVDKTGVVTRRTRYVIRVLTRDGRDAAFASLPYETSSDKVKSFQAWLIPTSGAPTDYGKKHTVDAAVYSTARELYGESRQLMISAYQDATPGCVFGYEAVLVEKSIYTQQIWHFQQKAPVEYSGFTITLPDGWTARSRTFNRDPIAPEINGKSQTWALRQLPTTKEEPLGPPAHARLPWLAVDFTPPPETKTSQRLFFASWSAISAYFSTHYDTASAETAALKSKADSLVVGATTPWERIARLCRFAQNVNYISITPNHAEAGGMIPRPAARVLQCNYGDCKDKTTLLRALLRTQGIASYPVLVYSGDSTHVRAEWVSPIQFNHCIVAIKVDDATTAPGIITHPALGRLLIFDPTNENAPPGWVPEEDLDGLGLLLAGAEGELIRLPSLTPDQNRFERTITARLDSDGAIAGSMTENFYGNSAVDARDEHKSVSATDYRTQFIEPWLGRTVPAARTKRIDATDSFTDAKFTLVIDFEARSYGKVMRDTLLVFKPVIVARRDGTALKKGKRTQPIVIPASSFSERVELTLPEGFGVDEPFRAAELLSPFGRYQAKAEVKGNILTFERALELRPATLPAEDYETARVFFEKILQAEQSPVVLKRL